MCTDPDADATAAPDARAIGSAEGECGGDASTQYNGGCYDNLTAIFVATCAVVFAAVEYMIYQRRYARQHERKFNALMNNPTIRTMAITHGIDLTGKTSTDSAANASSRAARGKSAAFANPEYTGGDGKKRADSYIAVNSDAETFGFG